MSCLTQHISLPPNVIHFTQTLALTTLKHVTLVLRHPPNPMATMRTTNQVGTVACDTYLRLPAHTHLPQYLTTSHLTPTRPTSPPHPTSTSHLHHPTPVRLHAPRSPQDAVQPGAFATVLCRWAHLPTRHATCNVWSWATSTPHRQVSTPRRQACSPSHSTPASLADTLWTHTSHLQTHYGHTLV